MVVYLLPHDIMHEYYTAMPASCAISRKDCAASKLSSLTSRKLIYNYECTQKLIFPRVCNVPFTPSPLPSLMSRYTHFCIAPMYSNVHSLMCVGGICEYWRGLHTCHHTSAAHLPYHFIPWSAVGGCLPLLLQSTGHTK